MWYVGYLDLDSLNTKIDQTQDAQGNYKLPQNEVDTIKQELIGLMISCPPAIQTQLGDAISLIADSDFWERWQTLVQVCNDVFLHSRKQRVGELLTSA